MRLWTVEQHVRLVVEEQDPNAGLRGELTDLEQSVAKAILEDRVFRRPCLHQP